MPANDLELFSTRELIDELVRRTTFLGMVIHCGEEARKPWTDGERSFRVHYNDNLDDFEARRLLSVLSEHMDHHEA